MIHCKFDKLVDIDILVPHPRNANNHPEKQIKMLAKIIDHTGWRHPVIVSNRSGYICAGHGRMAAARINGCEKVPVAYQDFENEAEEFQFLIADNKIAELADHDDSFMIDGIKELDLGDSDFELMGLDDFELDEPVPALLDEKATEHNLKSVHPTQKTVGICEFYQNISSNVGGSVLDLFGGSGSTLIACEKTKRKCFMSELDPRYVSVIIERWKNYTNQEAYLIEDSSGPLKDPVPYAEIDSYRGQIQ